MRIRRRPADVLHRAQAPSSSSRASSPAAAPLPSVARAAAPCSETAAARWAQQPASEEDPSVCQGKSFEPRPPSLVRNRQEEREEGAKATEEETRGKEDGRSEPEQKRPVHVVRSTPAAPKPEEEEGLPTGEVREKKSEDSRRDVKADEENSTAGAAMCKKGDGKGWHCKRVAQSGYSLCQYHLDKLRSYYSYSQAKKKQKKQKPKSAPVTEESTAAGAHNQEASRQKQQKKNKRRVGEDVLSAGLGISDSFYYYSGFGPRWGKRRSGDSGSVDGVMLPDGGASQVGLHQDAGDTAAAAAAAAVAGGEEDEYYYDCDASSRDGKPLKSRALSSLL